jgi:hypothetical protein
MAHAGWIQTFTGRKVTPLDLRPEMIDLRDIAHSLAIQARFSGHTTAPSSVAQHSVLVSFYCDEADALWGLLHDASEAYLIDLPRPLKALESIGRPYLEAEARAMAVICDRFGLPREMPPSVRLADDRALATEKRDLMDIEPEDWPCLPDPLPEMMVPTGWREAKQKFLGRFRVLVPEYEALEEALRPLETRYEVMVSEFHRARLHPDPEEGKRYAARNRESALAIRAEIQRVVAAWWPGKAHG